MKALIHQNVSYFPKCVTYFIVPKVEISFAQVKYNKFSLGLCEIGVKKLQGIHIQMQTYRSTDLIKIEKLF